MTCRVSAAPWARGLLVAGLLVCSLVPLAYAVVQAALVVPAASALVRAGASRVVGSGGALVLSQSRNFVLPGILVPIQVSRTVSPASALAAGLVVGGAVVTQTLVQDADCRFTLFRSLECDLGSPPSTGQGYEFAFRTANNADTTATGWYSSPQGACSRSAQLADSFNTSGSPHTGTVTGSNCGPSACQCAVRTKTSFLYYSGNLASRSTGNVQFCANGQAVRWDQKCPTGTYTAQSPDQVRERILAKGWAGANPSTGQVLDEAVAAGGDVPNAQAAPSVTGPAQLTGAPTTTTETLPDGTQRQTTQTTTYNFTYLGDTIQYTTTVVTTTTTTPPGGTPITETKVVAQPPPSGQVGDPIIKPSEPVEVETCGLPGKPKCAIDETGTPPPDDPFKTAEPSQWFAPLTGVITTPDVADTSWSWSFQLPSNCSVLNAGTFAGKPVLIDLCEYQPTIHDIMSLIWVGAGIWFAIGIVGRTLGVG